MKKTFVKFIMLFAVLAMGAMIYLFAHKGYFSPMPAGEKEMSKEEQAEDIGISTDDDPWNEMDKLVAAYYNKKGVSFKGQVKLIDDNGENEKIIEEQDFEFSVLGENFYYRLGNMEVVNKPDMVLVADHANKFISVSPVSASAGKVSKFFDISEFKKLMEERKASVKITQLGDQKMLTIENIEDPQVQGYRIYYDPGTYRISKILIGMLRLSPLSDDDNGIAELPGSASTNNEDIKTESDKEETDDTTIETYTYYMEIVYNEMKILTVTKQSFNPENKFISKNKNKIELTAAFKNYQLMNSGESETETQRSGEEQ